MKITHNNTLAACIVATFATVGAAQAATVTLAETTVDTPFGGEVTVTDLNFGADSEVLGFEATAFQGVDGSSSVSTSVETPFAGGRSVVSATAVLEQSATNTAGALQGYSFTFSLFDLSLQVQENYGYSAYRDYSNPFDGIDDADSDAAGNKISYEVLLNGTSIYSANIELFGGVDDGFTVANVENFTYSVENVVDPFDPGVVAGQLVTIDDLTETLFLGNFADGETIKLETILYSESQATNFEGEQTVGAFFGDPSGLAANGLIVQGPAVVTPPVSAVPLPAASWMLLAGLGGLGVMRRRKAA